jgi:hypothetical protein
MLFNVTVAMEKREAEPKKASIVSRYAGPILKIVSGSLLLGYAGGRIWDGIAYLRDPQTVNSGWTKAAKALVVTTIPLGVIGLVLFGKGIKQFKANSKGS